MITTGTDVRKLGFTASPVEQWSIKRLAWAYGCARSGTAREEILLAELKRRLTK